MLSAWTTTRSGSPPTLKKAAKSRLIAYGITPEKWTEILYDQNNCCFICHDSESALCVDHDHRTGLIRGALCARCNKMLGNFNDDPQAFMRAAAYLMRGNYGHISRGSEPIFFQE